MCIRTTRCGSSAAASTRSRNGSRASPAPTQPACASAAKRRERSPPLSLPRRSTRLGRRTALGAERVDPFVELAAPARELGLLRDAVVAREHRQPLVQLRSPTGDRPFLSLELPEQRVQIAVL